MSLTQGSPLPDVETTKQIDTKGPAWYDAYLQNLAGAGTNIIGSNIAAGLDPLQTAAMARAKTDLTGYEDYFTDAQALAEKAGKGITQQAIADYMNPYISGFTTEAGVEVPGVISEMERLSQQNMQRNLMPALKSFFGGTGGTGSQRMLGALGQMGADVQANLTGAQTKALADAYNKAVDTAGTQAGLYRQGAETMKGLGQSEFDAAIKSITGQFDMGAKAREVEQAKLLAPIAAAQGAANIFANLKVPTEVTEKFKGPMPGAYSNSPLSQIAGLGTLFAAGAGGTSAVQGITDTFKSLFGGGPGDSGSSGGALSDWYNSSVNWTPAANVDNTFGEGLGDWNG